MLRVFTRSLSRFGAFALLAGAASAQAQTDTIGTLTTTVYADAFYSAFTGDYSPGEVVEFESISSRADEINLNSLGLNLAYEGQRIRANAEVFTGVVREDAWGGNFVKNANVGFEVAEDFWLDAGYFSTYAGVESALPGDNVFSSVAVSTFQEPYFHSAFKAAYGGVEGWDFELWLMNQFSGYTENNDAKTIAAVIRYQINDELGISYTGTYGKEGDDLFDDQGNDLNDEEAFTAYNNVNLLYAKDAFELILNGSYAIVTNSTGDNGDESVSGVNGMATARYFLSDKFALAGRFSFLASEDRIFGVGGRGLGAPENVNDLTLSLQLIPTENTYVRLAGRTIGASDDIFTDNDGALTDRRFDLTLSAGIKLGRDFNFIR